jgi:membrane associated rhomboid family serine protease
MLRRQRTGSTVCPSCGRLVGVNDERCFNCGRRNPGMWGFTSALRRLGSDAGFTELVMGGTILLYGACLIAGGVQQGGGLFNLLSPNQRALFAFGASGAYPVFYLGRWWTVLSAGWLHASLLHIFFNLLWVRQLAPAVAELYGPSRMVILYTVSSVTGFLLSSAVGLLGLFGAGGITVGASAAIFGLLGALVHYGRRGSNAVGSQAWSYAIVLFLFGFFMRGVDNWAHLGGFAGGYLAARLLNPLREERADHTLVALACLAATALAVVASLLMPVRLR